jgi:hypothetical protein
MNKKGQYSIIAALLVAVILITTAIVTYSTVRSTQVENQPPVLSAIDEINLAIKQVLGFAVGYYGSVLQVTGNVSYAQTLATRYLQSGLQNIANMHPEWGASLTLNSSALQAYWFSSTSYSSGNATVNYNLPGLGILGVSYQASCELSVQTFNTTTGQACLSVTQDQNQPVVTLGSQNFNFYYYNTTSSAWQLVNPPSEPTAYANGTYYVNVPSGISPYSYVVQVEDQRGIVTVASSFDSYAVALAWNSSLSQQGTIVVELLQNGAMRWLGQNLVVTNSNSTLPFPPVPVRSIHVNETTNGVNGEVPFQIEDWAENYQIPLGLTSNMSLFSGTTMLVFLATQSTSQVTIWWNGSDQATQTPYAYTNRYFNDSPNSGIISNGLTKLQFQTGNDNFTVVSTVGSSTSTANFLRINSNASDYGSLPSYVITSGVVRDIVHQEAEWSNQTNTSAGGVINCPNIYTDIVLTLPANATYYTYQLTLMFVQSQQPRTIGDLCAVCLNTTSLTGQVQTENGTSNGLPIVSNATARFYNYSVLTWAHHWSQIISGTTGAGIMFTDSANQYLYIFDSISGIKTGALNTNSTGKIQLSPVAMAQLNFGTTLDPRMEDMIWYGAIDTFNTTATEIYNNANQAGLWTLVEYPPTVAVTGVNY